MTLPLEYACQRYEIPILDSVTALLNMEGVLFDAYIEE